nr:MAG TPA: Terminase [Caudoviricetes sp.]
MSLFEDFGIRQIKEDVKKLELQIRTINMPDKLRFRKMNLLAELYENLGEFEKADNTALTVIKQGTVVARKDTEVLDIVRDAYCIRGKRHFDDYMIATEWNREKNARFWLPRRKILEGELHLATKLDNFMNDPNMRLLSLSMPPGTGKSTLIKFLLAYIAGVYPMSANMYVSYSDGMIKMMYDSVVDMLTDDFEYQHTRIFGERATPTTSAQYGTISYRRRGDFPTIGMISLGGSVTGRTRANKFLITDDLVKNAEVARSPERLEKLWQDYTSTLTTRQIGDNVKQIMLGTIWSAYDPISRMMSEHENDPQYEFVCIPVWDENEHSNFLYDHPDRYTDEKIRERQESLDPVDFSCLYLQNPVEKEGMPLKANELMYYNGVLPDGEPDDIFFVTDVAWGGGDSLSMPVIYAYGDDWYLHDVVFDTSNKEVTRPRVVGKILQHACKSGRFEANNGGDEYADKVDEILRNDYGYMCNITSQKAPTNMGKLVRIEQYIPEIKKVYYRGKDFRDEEYNRFMKELCSISFRSKNLHDDAADSMAMAVDYKNTKVRHCKVTKFKRNGNL